MKKHIFILSILLIPSLCFATPQRVVDAKSMAMIRDLKKIDGIKTLLNDSTVDSISNLAEMKAYMKRVNKVIKAILQNAIQ